MNTALNAITKLAIPAAVGISLFQASLYDVKGGSRAVIFDRVAGVKNEVCLFELGKDCLQPQSFLYFLGQLLKDWEMLEERLYVWKF